MLKRILERIRTHKARREKDTIMRLIKTEEVQMLIDEIVTGLFPSVEEIAKHVDTYEVADRIDIHDIAQNIEVDDVAYHIDACDVAEYVEIDTYEIADQISLSEVAGHFDTQDIASYIDHDEVASSCESTIENYVENYIDNKLSEDSWKQEVEDSMMGTLETLVAEMRDSVMDDTINEIADRLSDIGEEQ
jgi:hypothetical protein